MDTSVKPPRTGIKAENSGVTGTCGVIHAPDSVDIIVPMTYVTKNYV